MITLANGITLADEELECNAIRAQGAGGQNVNKVATAIHLRFDIKASSLAATLKEKLLAAQDQRINSDGVIVIKAQRFRSQDKNRADAIARLTELIEQATRVKKSRTATRPKYSAVQKRLESKTKRGRRKKDRGRVDY